MYEENLCWRLSCGFSATFRGDHVYSIRTNAAHYCMEHVVCFLMTQVRSESVAAVLYGALRDPSMMECFGDW